MPPRRKASSGDDKKAQKSPKNAPKSPKTTPKAATTPKSTTTKKIRTRKANEKKNSSSNFIIVAIQDIWSKIKSLWKFYFGHLPFIELVTFLWFSLDALTHLTMELMYVIAAFSENWTGFGSNIWEKYGKADARWFNTSNEIIMSIEILTVLVGFICAWNVYCIYKKLYLRHLLTVIISTAELYGGWMTFCPEWITGSKNLHTETFMKLWIYLVFMNGVWVIIPLILLYLSSKALLSRKTVIKLSTVDLIMIRVVFFVIVVYAILVPVILYFDY